MTASFLSQLNGVEAREVVQIYKQILERKLVNEC